MELHKFSDRPAEKERFESFGCPRGMKPQKTEDHHKSLVTFDNQPNSASKIYIAQVYKSHFCVTVIMLLHDYWFQDRKECHRVVQR